MVRGTETRWMNRAMTEFLLMLAAVAAILLRATHRPAEARAGTARSLR